MLSQVFQPKILSGSIENRAIHDYGPRKKSAYLLRKLRNVGGPEVPVNAIQKWTKKMLFRRRSREYTGLCHAALVFSAREKVPCMVRTQLNVWGARRMCGHSSKNDTEITIFSLLIVLLDARIRTVRRRRQMLSATSRQKNSCTVQQAYQESHDAFHVDNFK